MQRGSSSVEGADGGNINIKNRSVPVSSGVPFSSDMVQPYTGTEFSGSLFDTPQSVLSMSSPQYDMFSSPFCGQFGVTSGSQCSFCNKDIHGRPVQFACSHKICKTCTALTDNRNCVVCMSPVALNPQYPPQMFLSPTLTPNHNTSGLDSSLGGPNSQSYQNVNGISSALQSVNLGFNELQEPFNLWDSSNAKLNTSAIFDTLSSNDEHPVFSPPGSDSRFQTNAPQSFPVNCSPCGVDTRAVAYCVNCRELLCSDCVFAHQRVRVTKDHSVVPLDQLLARMTSPLKEGSISGGCTSEDSSSRPSSVCGVHESRIICFCETCNGTALCFHCLPLHTNHSLNAPGDVRSAVALLVSESRQLEKSVEEAMESVCRMSERVDASVQSVASELRSAIHMHIGALEERKRELLQRLDTVRQDKVAALKTQAERLAARKTSLMQAIKAVEDNSGDEESVVLSQSFDHLLQLFCQPLSLEPHETDQVKFVPPDADLVAKINKLGELDSGPCARTSTIIGEGFRRAIRDRQCSVCVQLRDACGDISTCTGILNQITASIVAPGGRPLDNHITEREGGILVVSYLPVHDGMHQLDIMIRGVSINECPISIEVRRGRNYAEIPTQGELFSFGKEGSGDGELCRPWGICIDLRGRVLVADRSNNRIQIFDKDGNFLSKFGTGGTRAGQFDRPAGITTNTMNHIIVADKDNHRIQVFDENGVFMLQFGERGRPVGMFNYPWGVASNSHNHIAVSDTRNHRVQIFNANGHFVRKCGFDTAYFYKHLDSPRGLCYLPDGQLLITDFNNHRLAVVSSRNSPEMKVYGSEGDVEGMFCRPQGVKTDAEGHVLVCDSRNNRIQVFSGEDMSCVAVFGQSPAGFQMPTDLASPFQASAPMLSFLQSPSPAGYAGGAAVPPPRPLLDRPTDLAVSADGRVYVVDFGNNCIRVF